MRKSIAFVAAAVAASFFTTAAALAATGNWIGPTNGNWSDTTRWQDTIVPNAQGDVAQYTTGSSQITLQDIAAGVTVGTLKVQGTTNSSWQITPNQNVFLNQDGAGPLSATVINDIQTAVPGGNSSIFLNPRTGANPGAFWLEDDLHLINTSNSARTNGSIQIRGPLRGAGNITIDNSTNNIGLGQIQFTNDQSTGPGVGGFAGNIFINKGAVTFTRGDVFTPSPGNTVTIGAVGSSDDVTLAFTGGALGNMENGFIAAANTTGNVILASNPTTSGNVQIKTTNTNASAIQLNGNLSFDNRATNGSIFIIGDRVTGAGRLTKIGAGLLEITNTNTYSGGTVVDAGSLKVRHADAFNNGFGFHDATDGTLGSGNVMVNTTATNLEIDTALAAINVVANTATLLLAGGGSVGAADQGYAELRASINEVVGGLILGGVAQTTAGTYGSSLSGATFQNDEYFSGTGLITLTPVLLAGDYNNDGTVNAADYVLWRKNPGAHGGDPAGYNTWRANFGNPPGAGSGLGSETQGVPEPGAVLLAMGGILAACVGRRPR